MWLATLDGFFSTVTDTQEPSRMLIRARCEKDINNLFNRYRDKCPSIKPPTSDDARDYRYRLSISLGAATDAKRLELVPIAARTPVTSSSRAMYFRAASGSWSNVRTPAVGVVQPGIDS